MVEAKLRQVLDPLRELDRRLELDQRLKLDLDRYFLEL
jgi:hypothetical protein